MAVTTKLLHLRPPLRPITTTHRFSSRSSSDPSSETPPPPPPPPPPKSSFASYLQDVQASLKRQPPPPHHRPHPKVSDPFSKISSSEQIQKNLAEFRRLSAPPPSKTPISFEQLYKRDANSNSAQDNSSTLSLNSIRQSLRSLQSKNPNDSLHKKKFKVNLEPKYDSLPMNVFGKELKGVGGGGGVEDGLKGGFFKFYSCEDLGKRLMELRPEKKREEKNWFSLGELSERLRKLRVIDEKEMRSGPESPFSAIRDTMVDLAKSEMQKKTKKNVLGIDIFSNLGAEKEYMLSPPKEELVEKYFHPDNMSSAEKLKIELKKVRDEFKMSESDCGSARVQVAQLTTKIKHLSTALHKKDKHSRKGLQAMVQLRKKLLKYLRRTDWDSYCLVLSKLGLRDNPDYKN